MSEPLDPQEAATLFYSGSPMAFVAVPTESFVCGQWMGQRALVMPIPFDDPVAYFTEHPVMLYDPDSVPSGPAVSATITAGAPYATAPKERKHGRAR
jgi:hypothetical protein